MWLALQVKLHYQNVLTWTEMRLASKNLLFFTIGRQIWVICSVFATFMVGEERSRHTWPSSEHGALRCVASASAPSSKNKSPFFSFYLKQETPFQCHCCFGINNWHSIGTFIFWEYVIKYLTVGAAQVLALYLWSSLCLFSHVTHRCWATLGETICQCTVNVISFNQLIG